MLYLITLTISLATSVAETPRCETTYVHQCKAAVQKVQRPLIDETTSPLISESANAVEREAVQATAPPKETELWAEARGQCVELLDACQSSCPTRAHMCLVGMKAPMHQAAVNSTGDDRAPSSDSSESIFKPDAEERRSAPVLAPVIKDEAESQPTQ